MLLERQKAKAHFEQDRLRVLGRSPSAFIDFHRYGIAGIGRMSTVLEVVSVTFLAWRQTVSASRTLRKGKWLWATALGVICAVSACDRPTVPASDRTVAISASPYTVGEAANDLDAAGHFRSAGILAPRPGIIDPERAKVLAVAYAARFGKGLSGPLEREHGSHINFAALTADSRVYAAQSPYADTLPSLVAPGTKKRYGPFYMVLLRDPEGPVLSVAVSAFNAALLEDARGIIRFMHLAGNDFFPVGVPKGQVSVMPMSPEQATKLVFDRTKTRISKVPELVLPAAPYVPQFARWRIGLESPVAVRTLDSGGSYATRELYVGPLGEFVIPSQQQSEGSSFWSARLRTEVKIARRDLPLTFVRVTPSPAK